jgi:hypothetical protein
MITVASHQSMQIPLMPICKELRIIIFILSLFPTIKPLIHHGHVQTITHVQKFWCRRVWLNSPLAINFLLPINAKSDFRISGIAVLTNLANQFYGNFIGNGTGLGGLDAGKIDFGTLPDAHTGRFFGSLQFTPQCLRSTWASSAVIR